MVDETPNLHLSLVGTADEIANWQKIDSLIGLLSGPGVVLPGDTEVQGNLTVDQTTHLIGLLTASAGITTPDVKTTTLEASGAVSANSLTVTNGLTVSGGSVVLPAGSVAGAAFQPNASVNCAASGVVVAPGSGVMRITPPTQPPTLICNVNLPANEDSVRYEIVIAQLTMEVSVPASGSQSINPYFILQRGNNVMQSRGFTYAGGAATGIDIMDVPITMVRIAVPTDLSHTWSIWWQSAGGAGTGSWADILFGQMHCIQFR
jgi:hypothetical protein